MACALHSALGSKGLTLSGCWLVPRGLLVNTKSKTDLNLLTDKGVYPYDYMNSWEQFDEIKLPRKEDFYSQLYEEGITDKDYARENIVWKHFNIKNLGEHHDLYLMTDAFTD